MRYEVLELNETFNNVDLGDVTIVRKVRIDTRDDAAARTFAEEYAKTNGLKIFGVFMDIHNWYTGKIGRIASFYK